MLAVLSGRGEGDRLRSKIAPKSAVRVATCVGIGAGCTKRSARATGLTQSAYGATSIATSDSSDATSETFVATFASGASDTTTIDRPRPPQ